MNVFYELCLGCYATFGVRQMNDEPTNHIQRPPSDDGPQKLSPQEEKIVLETEKLQLEQQLLRHQLSRTWLTMEWLKSATVPAAILGAAITLYIGFGQIEQMEKNRSADRFDAALSRLSDSSTIERLTGVSGLRLFLVDGDTRLRKNALQYLVNAVSIETNEIVQTAIINVFHDLKYSHPDADLLDSTLRATLEQNRNLTSSILARYKSRVHARNVEIIAGSMNKKLSPNEIPDPIPKSFLDKLSQADYLKIKTYTLGRFEGLDAAQEVPLKGLAMLVSILVNLGAKNYDFSGIFCEGCDFQNASDLNDTNFEKSFLARANFTRVSLKKSYFYNADLSSTVFFSADLSDAFLYNNTGLFKDNNKVGVDFPILECANLQGADLSGTPLLVFTRNYGTKTKWTREKEFTVASPRLKLVKIDKNTKLDNFNIATHTTISNEYASKHPRDDILLPLQKFAMPSAIDPFLLDQWGALQYVNPQFPNFMYREYEVKPSSTMYVQYTDIDSLAIENVRSETAEYLRGYLSQTALADIPLVKAFSTAIGDDKKKQYREKRFERSTDISCDAELTPNTAYLIEIGYVDVAPQRSPQAR